MPKMMTIGVGILFLLGVLLFFNNLKDSYEILPGTSQKTLVPPPPYTDWREFVSSNGVFKAMLPVAPQFASDTVPIPNTNLKRKYNMYVSEQINGVMFLISSITYPKEYDTSDLDQMLRNTIDEINSTNPKNKVKDISDTTYQGHKALNFHFTNDQYEVTGIVFMVDQTVYLLSYIALPQNFKEAEYQHFIENFHMTQPTPTPK